MAHLPGAINITFDGILERVSFVLPDRIQDIVFYCVNTRCKRAGISV